MMFGRKQRAAIRTAPGAAQPVPKPVQGGPAPGRAAAHDYAAEAETLVHYFDFTSDDIASSIAACRAEAGRAPMGRVAWFIPYVGSAFAGGIHTVLRMAEHMRVAGGLAQVFVVIGAPDEAAARARVCEAYPALAAASEIVVLDRVDEVPELGPLDAAIATLWMTALPVLFLRDVRRKLYLVQDWEPEFYPAGSVSVLVEATYRFGFHGVCSGPTLADAYRASGGSAEHFLPAVDPAIFHAERPARAPDTVLRLLCYGRPGNPRNCYELASAVLRDVKAQLYDRVDIVLTGADWDPAEHGLRGCARNLGMVDYADMGELYRWADLCLCLTASRNPSLMLLELMACGTAIVTSRNRHGAWMLGDGDVAQECEPSRSELADAVLALLADSERRGLMSRQGQALVQRQFGDWTPVCAQVLAAVRG